MRHADEMEHQGPRCVFRTYPSTSRLRDHLPVADDAPESICPHSGQPRESDDNRVTTKVPLRHPDRDQMRFSRMGKHCATLYRLRTSAVLLFFHSGVCVSSPHLLASDFRCKLDNSSSASLINNITELKACTITHNSKSRRHSR